MGTEKTLCTDQSKKRFRKTVETDRKNGPEPLSRTEGSDLNSAVRRRIGTCNVVQIVRGVKKGVLNVGKQWNTDGRFIEKCWVYERSG